MKTLNKGLIAAHVVSCDNDKHRQYIENIRIDKVLDSEIVKNSIRLMGDKEISVSSFPMVSIGVSLGGLGVT